VQLGDVLQHLWSRLAGRRVIAPKINASRTWEGLLGGVTSTTLVGALLWWATPFQFWQAACMSMVVATMGFRRQHGDVGHQTGPRRRGLRDPGPGTSRRLDRIDSLCFAARSSTT
jgi:phosphatidate cytidylyltransferase